MVKDVTPQIPQNFDITHYLQPALKILHTLILGAA
jgi:hypothetical protein